MRLLFYVLKRRGGDRLGSIYAPELTYLLDARMWNGGKGQSGQVPLYLYAGSYF